MRFTAEILQTRKQEVILWAGGILLLTLVIIISSVTANALGERAEDDIRNEFAHLHTIVAQYAGKMSDINPNSDIKDDTLRGILRAFFMGDPADTDGEDVIKWLEANQFTMSNFRHEKLQELMKAGRSEYRTSLDRISDLKTAYQQELDSLYTGLWLMLNGYPKIDFDAFQVSAMVKDPAGTGVEQDLD